MRKLAIGMIGMISKLTDDDDENLGYAEENGAWCWRDRCLPCLSLTKALQSTSETFYAISEEYVEHVLFPKPLSF